MDGRGQASQLEVHELLGAIHSRRTTRRSMTASSHAVRSTSVAANGAHSSRIIGTSIVSRLAVTRPEQVLPTRVGDQYP